MLKDTIVRGQTQTYTQDAHGILLFYDNSRSKTLSITRESFPFGINHRNITSSQWMTLVGRNRSNLTGYKIPRNATITSLSVQTQNSVADCTFYIRRNGVVTNLTSITLVGQVSNVIDDLDIDLNNDDWLQVYLQVNSGNVDYPTLLLELAWR